MTLHASGIDRPPWPSTWPRPITARQVGASLFMLGLTSFLALGAVIALRGCDPRGPLIALAAPVVGVWTLQVIASRLRGRRHNPSAIKTTELPTLQRTALVIRYSGVQAWTYFAAVVTTTLVLLILSAAFLVAGLPDFPRYWPAALPAALTLPVAGYLILVIIQIARRRLSRGLVALQPEGLYHRAWAYEAFLPWEAILDVRAWDGGGPYVTVSAIPHEQAHHSRTSRLWRQPDHEFRPNVVLPAHAFPVDPAVLLNLVTYYASHPADRGELSDSRAVHRIRNRSL